MYIIWKALASHPIESCQLKLMLLSDDPIKKQKDLSIHTHQVSSSCHISDITHSIQPASLIWNNSKQYEVMQSH